VNGSLRMATYGWNMKQHNFNINSDTSMQQDAEIHHYELMTSSY
jgi:hypothetical protein